MIDTISELKKTFEAYNEDGNKYLAMLGAFRKGIIENLDSIYIYKDNKFGGIAVAILKDTYNYDSIFEQYKTRPRHLPIPGSIMYLPKEAAHYNIKVNEASVNLIGTNIVTIPQNIIRKNYIYISHPVMKEMIIIPIETIINEADSEEYITKIIYADMYTNVNNYKEKTRVIIFDGSISYENLMPVTGNIYSKYHRSEYIVEKLPQNYSKPIEITPRDIKWGNSKILKTEHHPEGISVLSEDNFCTYKNRYYLNMIYNNAKEYGKFDIYAYLGQLEDVREVTPTSNIMLNTFEFENGVKIRPTSIL